MSLWLRDVALSLEEDETFLPVKAGQILGIDPSAIKELRVVRRGIDARKKPRVLRIYTLEFTVSDEEGLLRRHQGNRHLERAVSPQIPKAHPTGLKQNILVAGMGPAGLFAALRLAQYGLNVTLVERGRPVERRVQDIRHFWGGKGLNPASNVQFGEGGAGTFSDGKLTTRINHPWTRLVLQTLVDFGAPKEIMVQAKPHVGTDRLRLVLINFRKALIRLGVEIRFETALTGLGVSENTVRAGILNDCEEVHCDSLVLAPGHSARDTYQMLFNAGVQMETKPFAMGVRVEHPVELINTIQYGFASHPRLPAAEYALSYNDHQTGRGVYSFCMCPGGEVVNASSEPDGLVVNGMSFRKRDGRHSNSALVVSVRPSDFEHSDPLAGVRFQRHWERAAFQAGGGRYFAPAQNLMAFLRLEKGPIRSTCCPGVHEADLAQVLPSFVSKSLSQALPCFDRRMRGFVSREATLVGVETRTSAPLRIVRGENGQSVSHVGLYPVGEGAGYAGGIMSAALDGLKMAEKIASRSLK